MPKAELPHNSSLYEQALRKAAQDPSRDLFTDGEDLFDTDNPMSSLEQSVVAAKFDPLMNPDQQKKLHEILGTTPPTKEPLPQIPDFKVETPPEIKHFFNLPPLPPQEDSGMK